mmetsp:Transcript_18401/g.49490  ORF Transcript_18401/g.49490 Transcript_18401/m.49490 type:complete len:235 (+) Transcript_18401:349-1053(+)
MRAPTVGKHNALKLGEHGCVWGLAVVGPLGGNANPCCVPTIGWGHPNVIASTEADIHWEREEKLLATEPSSTQSCCERAHGGHDLVSWECELRDLEAHAHALTQATVLIALDNVGCLGGHECRVQQRAECAVHERRCLGLIRRHAHQGFVHCTTGARAQKIAELRVRGLITTQWVLCRIRGRSVCASLWCGLVGYLRHGRHGVAVNAEGVHKAGVRHPPRFEKLKARREFPDPG